MKRPNLLPAARVAGLYALFAGAWIVLSDRALALVVRDPVTLTQAQTFKGLAFVLVSAALLFLMVRRELRMRELAEIERDRPFTFALDLLCIVEFDGALRRLNPAFQATLGYAPGDMEGHSLVEFAHPDDLETLVHALERLALGERIQAVALRMRHHGGTWRWLEWTAVPVVAERRSYAVARDVTDQRKLLEQLVQSQKMEAIGRLAGGVAHDFNNLLTAILGYCEILLHRGAPGDPGRAEVEEIFKAGQRAAVLTHQLLAFSRRQVLQPSVLNLGVVIDDMVHMLRRLIGESVEVVTAVAPDLGRVQADRGQIEQAIMNLAVNSRDALPHGGRLWIETANHDVNGAGESDRDAPPPGRWVRVTVRDNGVGMDEATLGHMFEPFFTTKPPGKGTGLGLATVYGIVEQSHGHVLVQSRPGEGASFHIYLPRLEGAEGASPAAPSPVGAPTGDETVLVVEDDDSVRSMVEGVLRELGYRVLVARGGEDAVRVSAEHAGPIHLLLTDVVMPGMNGPAAAGRLRRDRAELRVLYMSGHTDDPAVRPDDLASGATFLQKPFARLALALKVREVLATRE